ncbi:MAG: hypothetical protein JXQ72_11230 [Anaerolineae bacterium]|nr:hypothetical protein [Anaerolineae bacterium]
MIEIPGFDPMFDDAMWAVNWQAIPVALIPPGEHPGGFRVERRFLHEAMIFDRPYRLSQPFDCRFLYDPEGRLWMSNTPQEHIMMFNNGSASHGHVLVGGLGLGLYPQYAAAVGAMTRCTVIEHSPAIREIVEPTLSVALADLISEPLNVQTADIEIMLAGPVTTRYDTVFLDTWPAMDPIYLPAINRLRDQARRHLAPGGRVLLWGYRWMVQLFEQACAQVLIRPAHARRSWLETDAKAEPPVLALLAPVLDHFAGQSLEDLDAALVWCRQHIITVTGA